MTQTASPDVLRTSIPRCGHTGITLPECSCPSCLRDMLVSVGFLPAHGADRASS